MDLQLINSDSMINIDHHFKVTAGPGAGKTEFLVNHIKNVLNNSDKLGKTRKVACITYSNIGVNTIIKKLGSDTTQVEVSTIHSFLFSHIVKPYLHLIDQKYQIDSKQVDSPLEHIPSNGNFHYTNLPHRSVELSELKNLKWKIDGSSCRLSIRNTETDFHDSLFKYKQYFWKQGIIHYEDILAFAWDIISQSDDVLRVIRAKFPYIFIDEFQDTNPIQTKIVKLIAEKETTVGVIGDRAQSIFEFQGADVSQFDNFNVNNLATFKMEDNHRSTEQIIAVLNNIRQDITQNNPKAVTGKKPVIIVGDPLNALNYLKEKLDKSIVSLSYSNLLANSLRDNEHLDKSQKSQIIEEIFEQDSNSKRRKLFISIIKSIEYSRLSHFKDAIKELSRYMPSTDNFKRQKEALKVIKELLDTYNDFKDQSLWELYNKVINMEHLKSISKISEAKQGNSYNNIEHFYKENIYSDIAKHVKITDNDSSHRTIHKAKGSEFKNVLVVVDSNPKRKKYDEEKDLGFLLDSDISGNEEHRVFYVACSRATDRLYINVPDISDSASNKLSKLFDIEHI